MGGLLGERPGWQDAASWSLAQWHAWLPAGGCLGTAWSFGLQLRQLAPRRPARSLASLPALLSYPAHLPTSRPSPCGPPGPPFAGHPQGSAA